MNLQLEDAEARILSQVKFINYILEECRRRNKELSDCFGMSYGKFVGVGTVYEEAIHSMRKVKGELDGFLKIIRSNYNFSPRDQRRAAPRPMPVEPAEVTVAAIVEPEAPVAEDGK